VQTLPVTITPAPAQPGAISGNATICAGSSNTYSVAAVPGATSYTWTLPGGWSGTSTTNSIMATASAFSGVITVSASNACGTSLAQVFTVNVTPTPAQPGAITGNASVCASSTNVYSIAPVSGATSYTWTLPPAWSGSSTTNSIVATASAFGGSIYVTADNACGSSTVQSLAVTIAPNPVAAFSSTSNLLAATFTDGSTGATSWSWTFGDGGTSTAQNPTHTYLTAGTYNVCLIATANGCLDTLCQPITVIAVGMETGIALQVSVFPNPSSGVFHLETGVALRGVLMDVHGRVLFERSFEAGKSLIDLGAFADGIYFLRLRDGDSQVCLRLAKVGE
jgi:PKD repeat protein